MEKPILSKKKQYPEKKTIDSVLDGTLFDHVLDALIKARTFRHILSFSLESKYSLDLFTIPYMTSSIKPELRPSVNTTRISWVALTLNRARPVSSFRQIRQVDFSSAKHHKKPIHWFCTRLGFVRRTSSGSISKCWWQMDKNAQGAWGIWPSKSNAEKYEESVRTIAK